MSTDDFKPQFVPHERLSKAAPPNLALIAYKTKRYQLNQISCLLDTVEPGPNLSAIERVLYQRLLPICYGLPVQQPSWGELVVARDLEQTK